MEESAVSSERFEIEAYMEMHSIENLLTEVVNTVIKERPDDPYVDMAQQLQAKSRTASSILAVSARELLDGDGLPILEVEIETTKDTFSAMAPGGPLDGDLTRFGGRGLTKTIDMINNVITDKLVGLDPTDQFAVDGILTEEELPANAVQAISMAVCRAGAKHNELLLYEHIANLANVQDACVPVPAFNLINGGVQARNKLFVQETMVVPVGAESFQEAVQIGSEVQHALRAKLNERGLAMTNVGDQGGVAPMVETAEEALEILEEAVQSAGHTHNVRFALNIAASQFRHKPQAPAPEDVDAAGDGEGGEGGEQDGAPADIDDDAPPQYNTRKWHPKGEETSGAEEEDEGGLKSSEDMLEMYMEWFKARAIISVEDPFDATDTESFRKLGERVIGEADEARRVAEEGGEEGKAAEKSPEEAGGEEGGEEAGAVGDGAGENDDIKPHVPFTEAVGGDAACLFQIVADGCIKTEEDMDTAEENQFGVNAFSLSLSKAGTVSRCIALCGKAQSLGWGVVVGAENVNTSDDFVAELAVGLRAGQLKCGALCRMEHVAKYNQLVRIESGEGAPAYAGSNFRDYH